MVSAVTKQAEILDGRPIAEQIKREVAGELAQLFAAPSERPCLAAVRVGEDPASAVYVRNKVRACSEVGLGSELHALPESTTAEQLLNLIAELNRREEIYGILVQLPLPRQIDESAVIEAVDPTKDVDGFHPMNVGLLAMGRPRFVPCTPAGIIELMERNKIEIAGRTPA